jgi:hypothetical protein
LQKRCTRLAAASDKAYQLLAHGQWFSLGIPASSTTKTGLLQTRNRVGNISHTWPVGENVIAIGNKIRSKKRKEIKHTSKIQLDLILIALFVSLVSFGTT